MGGKRSAGPLSAWAVPWAFRSLAEPESLIRNGLECYHTNGINVPLGDCVTGLYEPLEGWLAGRTVTTCKSYHTLCFSAELTVMADQLVGGAIVLEVGCGGCFEFRDDALGEDFAEFDSPLVEGVESPEDTLDEDAVLIESDEFTQGGGG